MGTDALTEDRIAALLGMAKKVTKGVKKGKIKSKSQHEEWDFSVEGPDGERFTVYARQCIKLSDDFSCGIRWKPPSGEEITLVRYNGSAHPHRNHLEKTAFVNTCHIHTATERYVLAGREPDGFAETTAVYSNLAGAVSCLAADCHIGGLALPQEQTSLFDVKGDK